MKNIILILNLIALNLNSQNEVPSLNAITTKVFDSELNPILLLDKDLCKRSLLVVTSINCKECVTYFKKSSKINFLFVLNYESLTEINRILATYELNKKYCYFFTQENLIENKRMIFNGPSPMLLKKNNSSYTLYKYAQVDSLSKGFSDKNFRFL